MEYFYIIFLGISLIASIAAKQYINDSKDKVLYYSLFSILVAIIALITFLDKKLIPILEAMK